MQELDDAISALYDAAIGTNLDNFRPMAFDLLKRFVPFDSAFWASAKLCGPDDPPEHRSVLALHVVAQPQTLPLRLAIEFADEEPIYPQALANRGAPACIEDVVPLERFRQMRVYTECLRGHGIEQAMGSLHLDEIIGIWDYIVLWRSDRARSFNKVERELHQTLSLHMTNAWKHCRMFELRRSDLARSTTSKMIRRARALVDASGAIHTADSDFGAIVQAVFPGWQGRQLPYEFARFVSSRGEFATVAGLELEISRRGEFHILTITAKAAEMPLNVSEFEVARLFSAGKNHHEIAAERRVSPATVRNQIASIYHKLDIHSKVDLARIIG